MKAIALSKKPRTYIPKEFRGEENPPTFTIRSITRREMLMIQSKHEQQFRITDDIAKLQSVITSLEDNKRGEEAENEALSSLSNLDLKPIIQASLNALTIQIDILTKCLSGWENVPVSDTEFLPFNLSDIDCLDPEIIVELANEIQGIVTPEESENLEEVSASQSGPEMKSGAAETA